MGALEEEENAHAQGGQKGWHVFGERRSEAVLGDGANRAAEPRSRGGVAAEGLGRAGT